MSLAPAESQTHRRGTGDEDGGQSRHLAAGQWVVTTYFAEGFPYALIHNVADVMFKEMGASLAVIGLTSLFHLPWNLKFLWAPTLDRFETKRRFLLGCELLLIPVVGLLAIFGTTISFAALGLVFVVIATLAATHDAAIDGYYLEALDEAGRARYVGQRAAAYKIAMMLAAGPLLVVAGRFGWRAAWLAATGVMVVLFTLHWRLLPEVERVRSALRDWWRESSSPRQSRALRPILRGLGVGAFVWTVIAAAQWAGLRLPAEQWIALLLLLAIFGALVSLKRLRRYLERSQSAYGIAFVDFLAQPRVGRILAIVLLFRTGESFLMKMRLPFLRDACGMSLEDYGWINGTFGIIATIAGTFIAGQLIARHGLRRWLWPCVVLQNVPNLSYFLLSVVDQPHELGLWTVGGVVVFEDFGAGVGIAVFMVYLMRCCDPRHKVTHMALLTALMSVGFTIAGVMSGFLAEALGFAPYFLGTFVATIPAMLLLPGAPHMEAEPTGVPDSA